MAKKAARIVVKVGTATLSDGQGRLDRAYMADLVGQVARVRASGDEVVLVSSGAIGAGMEVLGVSVRPDDMASLQATAAVGQVRLVHAYEELFAAAGIAVGQVLLTRHETAHRQQYLLACRTLERLLEIGAVPIVNENDTTAVDEIRFGDNDTLAALVAIMAKADLVVVLTDTEGLYDAHPGQTGARLLERVEEITEETFESAGGPGSHVGSGGMATKIEAARTLMKAGIPMVVCHGRRPGVVSDAVAGNPVGTFFAAGEGSLKGRKLWIAYGRSAAGSVIIDDGARDALCLRGKSLLPAGVVGVEGEFSGGDAVEVKDRDGRVVAKGLVAMSSEDLCRVMGLRSGEAAEVLGEGTVEEVVHRDFLVIL